MYKTKRDLKLHLMVHEVSRPHKCVECDKTFLSTSKLKQHLNIHSGARPFKCRHCPKDFTNFPNWLKHTRRRHKVDHKTGEKLMVMPNFLKKANKNSKNAPKSDEINTNTKSSDSNKLKIDNNEQNIVYHVKCEEPLDIEYIETENNVTENLLQDELLMNQSNEMTDAFTSNSNMIQNNPSTDLSTITVNNRTLPLNTSDDLERAASLLMQQSLDLEDDLEYTNIKSETFDTLAYENSYTTIQDIDKSIIDHSINYELASIQSNFQYSNAIDSCFTYSYYPQATQCDFTMMPLPPINTVKNKLNAVDSTPPILSSIANIL